MVALQNREAASAAAAAVNASNYRTVLAEASTPASLKEVFPHPPPLSLGPNFPLSPEEDVYTRPSARHRRCVPPFPVSQPESLPPHLGGLKVPPPRSHYDTLYGTLGPRALHQSIRYKERYRDEHPLSGSQPRRSGQWYAPLEGALVYPTIRRVRSLHAPPEDRPFFLQNNPYPRKGHAEIHQVQPYFENGKVQYRYNPYSDSAYGDLDTHRGRHYSQSHMYTIRRGVPASSLKMGCAPPPPGCYPNPLSHVMPEKDYIYQGHEGCYPPQAEDPSLPLSLPPQGWGPELSERHYHSSTLRRDGRAKRKPPPAQHPSSAPSAVPQYAGMSPVRPKAERPRHEGARHIRHRSDSGRDLLISTEEPGGHFKVTMVTQSSPEQLFSEVEIPHSEQLRKADLGAREALMLKQNSYRSSRQLPESRPLPPHLSLHKEYSCPDFKHGEGGGGGGGGGRVLETERGLYRTLSSRYPEEEIYHHARPGARAAGAGRHERSQGIKGHGVAERAKMESDPWGGSHYTQPKVRSHSFVASSRYDKMEGYVPAPGPGGQPPRTPKRGPFPNHGCMPPSSHRLYSTALGQGGYLAGQTRTEAEVYAE